MAGVVVSIWRWGVRGAGRLGGALRGALGVFGGVLVGGVLGEGERLGLLGGVVGSSSSLSDSDDDEELEEDEEEEDDEDDDEPPPELSKETLLDAERLRLPLPPLLGVAAPFI